MEIINGKAYFIYKDENQSGSKSDSTEIVKYQKLFYIEITSNEINRIQDTIIRSDDTLQVVDHYFTNYRYKNVVGDAPSFVQGDPLAYKTISEEEEYAELTYEPIKEGAMLSKNTYVDIDNNEVQIFGASSNSSVILFSFIGCAPCEIVLRELREAEYNFTDKVDLYYSSFQNEGSSLKGYLKKKGFPFKAFGQESNMVEEFSLYYSPSFAWIDSDGKFLKIMEGYDEEMSDALLGILGKELAVRSEGGVVQKLERSTRVVLKVSQGRSRQNSLLVISVLKILNFGFS